eukprot:g41572.t1
MTMNMLKATKNMAYFFLSEGVFDNEGYSIGHVLCQSSEEVVLLWHYCPRAEKLRHVLRSLQHVIVDDERHAKIIPTPLLLALKQPPNFKQTIIRRNEECSLPIREHLSGQGHSASNLY